MKKKLVNWRKPEDLVHLRQPQSCCPSCFMLIDGVTAITGGVDAPKPGDFSVCLNCGAVLEYDAEMQVGLRTLMDIPMNSRLAFAQTVMEIKNRGPLNVDKRHFKP